MTQSKLVTAMDAASWLAGRSPVDVERSVASLARSHGVSFVEKREVTFATEGPNGEMIPAREPRFLGFNVHGVVTDDLADRMENFLTPASATMIERWLAELSVICAKRPDDDFTEELRLTAYTSRLSQYPADLVRHVLIEQTWKFFPTWHELAEILDARVQQRESMIRAVRAKANERSERVARQREEEKRPRFTDEEMAAMRKRMATLGNETLQAMRRNMGVPQHGCVR